MQNTYKIVSLLLDYPNEEVKENLGGMMEVIEEEGCLNESQCAKLRKFLHYAISLSLT